MKKPRYTIHPGTALAGVVAFLLVSFTLFAGCAPDPPEHDALASGQASYKAYCESCHGLDGHGLGEVVGDLKTIPADLTALAVDNGGTFPVETVYQAIDGRRAIPEHGTREMPVWGNIWSDQDGTPVQHEVVEQRINELVEYLRSIQRNS